MAGSSHIRIWHSDNFEIYQNTVKTRTPEHVPFIVLQMLARLSSMCHFHHRILYSISSDIVVCERTSKH